MTGGEEWWSWGWNDEAENAVKERKDEPKNLSGSESDKSECIVT